MDTRQIVHASRRLALTVAPVLRERAVAVRKAIVRIQHLFGLYLGQALPDGLGERVSSTLSTLGVNRSLIPVHLGICSPVMVCLGPPKVRELSGVAPTGITHYFGPVIIVCACQLFSFSNQSD